MIKEVLKKINKKQFPKNFIFAPEWLVLGVNNVCNLHCKMCDVGTQNLESNFAQNLVGARPIHMPEELLFSIIDQAAKDFPNLKLGYAFTEPLVYKHLISTLEYANSKKLFTSITTNALTLKQKAKALCEAGLNEINISLDGTAEIHNLIRGHKSSFEKAIDGIKELLKHPNPPSISIYCVITDLNSSVLLDFVNYFKDFPISNLGFLHANFTHQYTAEAHNLTYLTNYPATASNLDEFNPEDVNLRELEAQIQLIRKNKYSFSVSFSPDIKTFDELSNYYLEPNILFGKMCNDLFRNIMIKSDGSVIPAHGRCYNLTVGNMYESGIKEIWNSEILGKFRSEVVKAGGLLPACSRCCSAF